MNEKPKGLNRAEERPLSAHLSMVVSELDNRKFNRKKFDRDKPRGRQPPVRIGERYKVKIEALGKDGDGIARIKGFVVFVPKTRIGDEVEIVINSVKQKFAFGQVIG